MGAIKQLCAIAILVAATMSVSSSQVISKTTSVNPDKTCTSPSPCIDWSNGAKGAGIEGDSARGSGVVGTTMFASGSNRFQGVLGIDKSTGATQSAGVTGRSSNGFGVTGFSKNGVGASFQSVNNYALNTQGSNGILSTGTLGFGIYSITPGTALYSYSSSSNQAFEEGVEAVGGGGGTGLYAVGEARPVHNFARRSLRSPRPPAPT